MPRRVTLRACQRLAAKRQGKCVSTLYVSRTSKLEWECVFGHRWQATYTSIREGSWCPKCGWKAGAEKRRLSIEECRALARERGGKCLSTEYVDSTAKLAWECALGHRWQVKLAAIVRGSWCPECGRLSGAQKRRHYLSDYRLLAKERGGRCLSKEYVGSKTALDWECAVGHRWKACPFGIRHHGRWCPICSRSTGDRHCRAHFEALFGAEFPPARPTWLLSSRGNLMRLDGLNSGLGLAFEYQGRQSYLLSAQYPTTTKGAGKRLAAFLRKQGLCQLRGIALIHLPGPGKVRLEDMRAAILERLDERSIAVPPGRRELPINPAEESPLGQLGYLRRMAEERGGKCLSTEVEGGHGKLEWQCAKRHRWLALPSAIRQGRWCLACARLEQRTLADCRRLAKAKRGECLASLVAGPDTELEWECERGHRWFSLPGDVAHGHWCVKCAAAKGKTLEDCQRLAAKKGGLCLSSEYVNARAKMSWECALGHQWETHRNSVQQGQWCPVCGARRGGRKRARQLAAKRAISQ